MMAEEEERLIAPGAPGGLTSGLFSQAQAQGHVAGPPPSLWGPQSWSEWPGSGCLMTSSWFLCALGLLP